MSDLTLIRTDSDNTDFRQLIALLDKDLAIRDVDEHAFYDQFNKLGTTNEVVVAYQNEIPIGFGPIKPFSKTSAEVKRMFAHPDYIKKGIATRVITELEHWAAELGISECVLETGKKQPEAIALYQKIGYQIIPNYGQYIIMNNSVCMTKKLSKLDAPI